jgi:ATP-dependent protease ClpP protease subunit
MIHEVSGSAGGNINDIRNETEELRRLNAYFMGLLAKNCGKTENQLQKLWTSRRESYMNAEEAVKFGIADYVGIPTIHRYTSFDLKFMENDAPQRNRKEGR